jgi:3-methyladenine DNA glycosylase AlkC
MKHPTLPEAPRSIQKGVPLKHLLGRQAVETLAANLLWVDASLDTDGFRDRALDGLEALELMPRAHHIAAALRWMLPRDYRRAVEILMASLTPPVDETEGFGLAGFFYLPHGFLVANHGIFPETAAAEDPFEVSMSALWSLTQRFTSEFAIRPFLLNAQDRTLSRLMEWCEDPSPHVRRLCSEGTRPRLPWGRRIPAFGQDPTLALPILERLKEDSSLYVRRSVANHLGDVAKDHPDWVMEVCRRWLADDTASRERRWVVRHALRYPVKKGDPVARELHARAGRAGPFVLG